MEREDLLHSFSQNELYNSCFFFPRRRIRHIPASRYWLFLGDIGMQPPLAYFYVCLQRYNRAVEGTNPGRKYLEQETEERRERERENYTQGWSKGLTEALRPWLAPTQSNVLTPPRTSEKKTSSPIWATSSYSYHPQVRIAVEDAIRAAQWIPQQETDVAACIFMHISPWTNPESRNLFFA